MRSQYRIDDEIFSFNPIIEREYGIDSIKVYAYSVYTHSLEVIGEILSKKAITKPCQIRCTAYDENGDILQSIVAGSMHPDTFFNRFPFYASFFTPVDLIEKIEIEPIDK